MSFIKKQFHNIKCDRCGELIDPEFWHDETFTLEAIMPDCQWKEIGYGNHYCPDCWDYDDDDNIIVKEDRNEENNV